jgi:site-specific DNA recombinase
VNDRAVETESVFDRHAATDLSVAYAILVPQRRARIARAGQEGRPQHDQRGDLRPGSSARQKKDETIASQTAALRAHAEQLGLDVPDDWVFEDEGHSGATLVRPALERLRDLIAGVGIDVVLCYSPDRLARKFAYQALLIEEFTRAGTRVEFIKGPRGDTPEDQLLVQFQGMFAEYEKAQILERYRRGKTHRAQTGSINVLSGAPFGYRYVAKNIHTGAAYEIIEHEAALVGELFRRYVDDGASIAELARWLTDSGVPTRTGKHRWDRSVVWGMLRNPAYAGRAVFGKTMIVHESPNLNRVARLQGRATPRAAKTVDRPHAEGTEIPVPAVVSEETFARVAQRLADNKRFASRNSRNPSLLQGIAACAACGYGYYRTTTRTTNKKIHYYRCLGSDNYRYEAGRVCANKPVRADYLDTVVWDHITGLLAEPRLIHAEIDKRLEGARAADPVTRQRTQLENALGTAANGIARMIEAFGEQLITIDELRARMPDLRAREANLRNQIQALDAQLADREAYLTLAADLQGFLTQLHARAETSTLDERRRVLKLLIKDVLIGPEKITIRHRIPLRERVSSDTQHTGNTDTEVNILNIAQCVGGVFTPPCGLPVTGRRTEPCSITPARRNARSSASRRRSLTRSSTADINPECGIEPKQSATSVSTTQRAPANDSSTRTCRPSCAERWGRNPNEHGRKSASKIGSSTIFTAACTIRSRTEGIDSGRRSSLPGFGMNTRRAGNGR